MKALSYSEYCLEEQSNTVKLFLQMLSRILLLKKATDLG